MVAETTQHAGHADIIRELLDGQVTTNETIANTTFWRDRRSRVQEAADHFREPAPSSD
jgi:hypothetical protein